MSNKDLKVLYKVASPSFFSDYDGIYIFNF